MTLWVLKGGKQGEREATMLSKNILAIGLEELGDLSNLKTKDELQKLMEKNDPEASKASISNYAGQFWAFLNTAKIGDLVVVPLKTTSLIAIGKIASNYIYSNEYGPIMKHTRAVEWIKKDIPISSFDQDLLYTFGAFMTFCKAERNNAEERVKDILAGKQTSKDLKKEVPLESHAVIDLEEMAKDQIVTLINQKFKGHALAQLVASILNAQGFNTQVSPPGPDGGVDISASPGILGFGEPRICVQVKSGDTRVDVDTYRQLKGTMDSFKATHGILVSWGGFKDSIRNEAKNDRFKIKLWSSKEVVEELLNNYEKIDPDTKSSLSLKQIYVLSSLEKD